MSTESLSHLIRAQLAHRNLILADALTRTPLDAIAEADAIHEIAELVLEVAGASRAPAPTPAQRLVARQTTRRIPEAILEMACASSRVA